MLVSKLSGSLVLFLAAAALPVSAETIKNERLIVRFKEGVSSYASGAIHKKLGIRTNKRLNYLKGIEVVDLPAGMSPDAASKLYEKDSRVAYVERDFQIRVDPIDGEASKNPTEQFAQQWALKNVGQKVGRYSGKAGADINGTASWELTKGDDDVILGVIDTGIFHTHPNLKDNMWSNPAEIAGNGEDDDGNGFVDDIHGINAMDNTGDPMDDNGHGTHCAGIMGGAGVDGKGTLGVNQKVSIIGCKFLDSDGSGSMSDALVCMDYFVKLKTREKNPVDVTAINASWGGGRYSQAMFDAIKKLRDAGILFVAAAGNDSDDNDTVGSYPANYQLDNIISVAATNNKDELAYFSNYGRRSVHVGAPGQDILSTYLDGQYKIFSGTSMAAPYVTGLIGLLKSKDRSLDWKQLKNLAISGGNELSALSAKTVSGRRIRGADKDGHGSLTCSGQKVFSRVLPTAEHSQVKVGDTVEFKVFRIKCATPDRVPSLTVNMGHTPDFVDVDGTGVFTASWKAAEVGSYEFDLGDGQKVTVLVE